MILVLLVLDPLRHWTIAEPLMQTRYYEASTAVLLNPDRGFMDWAEPLVAGGSPQDFAYVRERGATLAFLYLDLGSIGAGPMDNQFLQLVQASFEAARLAGIRLVVRAAYDLVGDAKAAEDLTLTRVAADVSRLAPVFLTNQHVIAVVQAGLLGHYGEWHGWPDRLSTPEAQKEFLELALNLAPADRFVQVRAPAHMMRLYPRVLPALSWYDGSSQARIAHHNDCFLSSPSDSGTYWPADQADEQKRYIQHLAQYAPIGGETCEASGEIRRTACAQAMAEMAQYRWSFINKKYYLRDMERWQLEGCYGEIEKRLGYRYRLSFASFPKSVHAGDQVKLILGLVNDGWAGAFNPRAAALVLVAEGLRQPVHLGVPQGQAAAGEPPFTADARTWLPGPGKEVVRDFILELPGDLPVGTYQLELAFPDPAPEVREMPQYAIQLANRDIWNAAHGSNRLGLSLRVE